MEAGGKKNVRGEIEKELRLPKMEKEKKGR